MPLEFKTHRITDMKKVKLKKGVRRPWSEDEIKLLQKLFPSGRAREIANRTGRTLAAVRQQAYNMGITTREYHRPIRMSACLNLATICGPLNFLFMRGFLAKIYLYCRLSSQLKTGPVFWEQTIILYPAIIANFIVFSLHLISILVRITNVYNNYAENSLNYFGGKFFDLPNPALIIVGRKSIIEGENLIFLRVSTITRNYSSIFVSTKFREEGRYIWTCRNS